MLEQAELPGAASSHARTAPASLGSLELFTLLNRVSKAANADSNTRFQCILKHEVFTRSAHLSYKRQKSHQFKILKPLTQCNTAAHPYSCRRKSCLPSFAAADVKGTPIYFSFIAQLPQTSSYSSEVVCVIFRGLRYLACIPLPGTREPFQQEAEASLPAAALVAFGSAVRFSAASKATQMFHIQGTGCLCFFARDIL